MHARYLLTIMHVMHECPRTVSSPHDIVPLRHLPLTVSSPYGIFPLQYLPLTVSSPYGILTSQYLLLTVSYSYGILFLRYLPPMVTSTGYWRAKVVVLPANTVPPIIDAASATFPPLLVCSDLLMT